MNDLLLQELLDAGTPPLLVAKVAAEIARAGAANDILEQRRAHERANSARYRQRIGDGVPGWLRKQIFERDGYQCVDCGATERLECDHIIPVSKGGSNEEANLQTLCKPCNARKRDRIRKSDGRGLTRNNSEKTGIPSGVPDNPDTPLSLSPNENNSNPHTHTPVNKPRARKDGFVLPSHIPALEWAAYVEMRARIRKPMTPHAMGLAVKELDKLAADGWPPGAVLNHSTMNSYQGLFPPKDRNNGRSQNLHDPRSGASLLERLRADDAAAGLA